MDNKKKRYTYDYPRPALTADCVIFGFNGSELKILLVERGVEPYKGYWALPGGFMRMEESIEECARRELMEETGLKDVYLEQCHTFSATDRDPRGRVVTVAFIALIRPADYEVVAGDDAAVVAWFDASMLPPLAFDHKEIIAYARDYLKEVLRLRPIAFRLLNKVFSIDDLRRVYEVINDTVYDRRNFERKALQSRMIEPEEPCGRQQESYAPEPTGRAKRGRTPRLFSFRPNLKKGAKDTDNDINDEERDGSIKDLFNF